jgi:hypothetical protein
MVSHVVSNACKAVVTTWRSFSICSKTAATSDFSQSGLDVSARAALRDDFATLSPSNQSNVRTEYRHQHRTTAARCG